MGFGPELHEIRAADTHLTEGIQFLSEVRDFVRERADLERDFAKRLETLSRKYATRRGKRDKRSSTGTMVSAAAGGGEQGGRLSEDDSTTTVHRAWSTILQELEHISKAHLTLSEHLTNDVAEKLKTLATKKDEARKRHIAFSQRLIAERDKVYGEKDKAKYKYDESCDAVEAAKHKHNRAPDEKSAVKLKKQWHHEIVELNNNKNLYVLALVGANACKSKYYHDDVPGVLKGMQELSESTSRGLKYIWQDYIALESASVESCARSVETVRCMLDAVDPRRDVEAFVASRGGMPALVAEESADFAFVPSGLWKDSGEMATDDFSRIFLTNKLGKLRKRSTAIKEEIAIKARGLEGTKTLFDAYTKDRNQGDPDDVKEAMLESMRELVILETMQAKYETRINKILQTIGEPSPDDHPHTLKNTSFTIPTSCDYCQQTIWGVTKPGLTCEDASSVPPTLTANSLAYVLYDYTPSSSEEIAIAEGDTIRVVEPDDGSGWTLVTHNGQTGLVPTSYIEPAAPAALVPQGVPSVSPAAETAHGHGTATGAVQAGGGELEGGGGGGGAGGGVEAVYQAFAINTVAYDYTKNGDDELTITGGQHVWVLEQDDGSGWVMVSDGTNQGLVPKSYLVLPSS
ncbi:hypothetical protein HK104_008885 [Borealophlyctis nickersoniae]|nr:hypothetical protein HK104_008885 [Borealophlyctis nickersoniae]